MGIETRNKIAKWFFLAMGIAGVSFQMYEFFTGHIEFSLKEVGVTALFAVFMFRPTILLDVFNTLRGLIPQNNDK